jgi:hypothetical protein
MSSLKRTDAGGQQVGMTVKSWAKSFSETAHCRYFASWERMWEGGVTVESGCLYA